jgi:uncharacterized protein (DUF427 family)
MTNAHPPALFRAVWRGEVIAASDRTQVVDGYTYFPAEAIVPGRLREVTHTTACAWKGTASYFDVVVGDAVNAGAAWTYATPKPAAAHLAGWIGFWRGVEIEG